MGLMLCLWSLALAGTPEEPGRRPFEVLGTDQGLATGSVLCMAQDQDGFLWMGSENGLLRYEGGHCRQWSAEDGLPSSSVSRMVAAPQGGIWISTSRGVGLFKDGRFAPALVDGAPAPGSGGDLAVDRRGRLWVYTSAGLLRQRAGLAFDVVPWKAPGSVYAVSVGPRTGTVYVAGQHGLQVFREDGTSALWGAAQGLPPKGPVLAAEDGLGRVWAGSGRTLVVKEPGSDRFTNQSRLLAASLSPNGQPLLDQDGRVWLPTQNGAQKPGGERLDAASGLPFRWVRTLFRDREGALWVVGSALAHMLGRDHLRNHPLSQGDSGEVVWFMARDARGVLLAATDNGVVAMEPGGPRPIPGTGGWRIKGLALDRSGTLWMVNTRGPTLWLRPGRGQAEVAPLGEAGIGMNSVHVDGAGRVWLGGIAQGLLRWDPAARKLAAEVPPAFLGKAALGIYEFHEDGRGRLWAGADGGLLVRDRDGRWQYFADAAGNRIRGMAILPDGSAWVHHEEPFGLERVRLEEGRLQVVERRGRGQGLPSNMVYAVRTDEAGRLWVSTDKGLDRLDPPLHFGRHDGMLNEDCSISALLVEKGAVWVGTSGGLVRVADLGAEADLAPPRAFILQMASGGRNLEPPFGPLAPLPYDQATLDFRVAAPSYLHARDLRYQVRLVGLENAWRDLDGRQVHFPALPEGSYRFEVRAAQPLGPFGEVSAMAFRIRPPWWRTGWAYGLAALSGLLAVYGLVRVRIAALARSKAALEALVDVRTRELSQRNEELSEALGNVKQLSGLIPICAHCKKIRDDDGYWNQLEEYISSRTEAGFSHGICPECASAIFPDFVPGKNKAAP